MNFIAPESAFDHWEKQRTQGGIEQSWQYDAVLSLKFAMQPANVNLTHNNIKRS